MYRFEFKNFLGTKLTEMEWVWYSNIKGQFNGEGAYLTNAGAEVKTIYALDTEHISSTINALNPVNLGNSSFPVGGLTLQNACNSHGLFKSTTVSCVESVGGLGTYDIITCAQN